MYVVIAETLMLALGVILARRGRRMMAGGLAAPLLVALCALIAVAGVVWLSRTAHVFYAPPVHFTLELVAAWRSESADMLNHVFVPLGVIAFAFVLGTAITAATLIRTAVNSRLLPER
jgi:hypothetical protein